MEVPLHLVLVITFLALSHTNGANTNRTRLIPISTSSSSPISTIIKNTTEINNRDLNKISTDNPKTDILESKLESIIDKVPYNHYDDNDDPSLVLSNHTKKERNVTEKNTKQSKEKHREENGKAINDAAEPFWSSEYHSKNSVLTLPPVSDDLRKFSLSQESKDFSNFDLTTPKSELFDKKFKETVDSVDQELEEIERNHAGDSISHFHDEADKDDSDFHILKDMPAISSHPLENNHTVELYSSKLIVNNETSSDKNWIHKNLNVEQIKKVNYETIYNDTSSYGEESTTTTKTTTAAATSTTTTTTTTTAVKLDTSTEKLFTTLKSISQKPFLHKELIGDKIHSHLLSNKIETEGSEPIKVIVSSTSTTQASTTKLNTKNPVENVSEVPSKIVIVSTYESTTAKNQYVSDNENQVIPETPLPFFKKNLITNKAEEEKIAVPKLTTTPVPIESSTIVSNVINTSEIVTSDTTTTEVQSTTIENTITEENTTEIPSTTIQSKETTTELDKTTVTLNSDIESTTTLPQETTTITTVLAENPTEPVQRTSKSLENFIGNEDITSIETTTILPITTTTLGSQGDIISTTLENEHEPAVTTQTELPSTISNLFDAELETTTIVIPEVPTIAQERFLPVLPNNSTTSIENSVTPIEDNGKTNTTLLPDYLNPHFTYGGTQPSTIADASDVVIVHDKTYQRYNGTTHPPTNLNTRINRVYVPSYKSTGDRSDIRSTTESLTTRFITTTEDSTKSPPTEDSYTKDNDESNSGKIAAIVISSVGAICLVVLAGLLYVMKKRQKRLNYGPRCRPVSLDDYSIDNLSVYNSVMRKGGNRLSKRSFGNPAFEDPTGPSHPLNFPALAKFSSNLEDIKAEYEEIPQISAKTSELPDGCETKNRYANVIPLPETRVFLKSIEGYPNSDYINANYVTGSKNIRKYYIAAQAPMQNTVDDFWRMIWEQNVKVVLMLTHLIENGFEKCVDYLPESEIVDCNRSFGDFQIIMKRREVKEKYIISILQLKNMVSNSWREVTHFWYLGWPEKGVPSEANSLIAFLIEARSYMKTNTLDKKDIMNGNNHQNGNRQTTTAIELNPVVVHCSPGTGRTGVAIACDIAIRDFETSRLVDIPKIVYKMRRDRASAVQTREQYQFIYKVVSLYATKLTGGALENF